jgi:dTDP-4-dehydrorhamnose 3,5-epimerase
MQFNETRLPGAFVIELEKRGDKRGFFARFFCDREFAKHGLERRFVQINDSLSVDEGTLRGLHYQLPPDAEVKVVRCVRGALWDVILDLRPHSPTFGKWYGTDLTAENRRMMYIPRGFAHGFLTMAPQTEALYLVSAHYAPERERGVRWNDPKFGVAWPAEPRVISIKDANQPDFDPAHHLDDTGAA